MKTDPFQSTHEGTITRHEEPVMVGSHRVGANIHYEVDCSCGKFHRSGPSKAALHKKLDTHVATAPQ